MNTAPTETSPEQLSIPGMPARQNPAEGVTAIQAVPGQEVIYLGKVRGGPRYGARGTVRRAKGKRALVDMGRSGAWHIPYYFLSSTRKAA